MITLSSYLSVGYSGTYGPYPLRRVVISCERCGWALDHPMAESQESDTGRMWLAIDEATRHKHE